MTQSGRWYCPATARFPGAEAGERIADQGFQTCSWRPGRRCRGCLSESGAPVSRARLGRFLRGRVGFAPGSLGLGVRGRRRRGRRSRRAVADAPRGHCAPIRRSRRRPFPAAPGSGRRVRGAGVARWRSRGRDRGKRAGRVDVSLDRRRGRRRRAVPSGAARSRADAGPFPRGARGRERHPDDLRGPGDAARPGARGRCSRGKWAARGPGRRCRVLVGERAAPDGRSVACRPDSRRPAGSRVRARHAERRPPGVGAPARTSPRSSAGSGCRRSSAGCSTCSSCR